MHVLLSHNNYFVFFFIKKGNTISLIVLFSSFGRKKILRHSTFVYMAFLSIVDIFVLVFGLGDIVIIAYFRSYIRNENFIICRVHSFLTYVSTHCSSFILALVSIDRAIATNMISFAKTYCKPGLAFRITCLAICISILINFHNLLFLGHIILIPNLNRTVQFECASKEDTLYEKFMDPYFEWADLICYSILPFIIMTVCSFLIIKAMFLSSKRISKLNDSYDRSIKRNNLRSIITSKPEMNSIKEIMNKKETVQLRSALHYTLPSNISHRKINKATHLSYTLIALNVIFFILISPLVIVRIIIKEANLSKESTFIINIVYLLAYSNHSLNFFLYGFTSPLFRTGIIKLLKKKT